MNEFLPVTEAQAVETKISNSVKISKQLMVSELSKRIATAQEEYEKVDAVASVCHAAIFTVGNKEMVRQVRMSVANDGNLTRFRNLYKEMSLMMDDEEKVIEWKNNVDVIDLANLQGNFNAIINHEFHGKGSFTDTEDREAWVNHGMVTVDVKTVFPDLNFNGHHGMYDNYLGFTLRFILSNEVRDLITKYIEAQTKANAANKEYKALCDKLKNIDKVAEQMEAQLLVKELAKTEEGKEALTIASGLVSDMLGETPMLLGEFKE